MEDPAAEIQGVVTLLLKGSTKERQNAVKKYFTEDSIFVHPLLSLRGRLVQHMRLILLLLACLPKFEHGGHSTCSNHQ